MLTNHTQKLVIPWGGHAAAVSETWVGAANDRAKSRSDFGIGISSKIPVVEHPKLWEKSGRR